MSWSGRKGAANRNVGQSAVYGRGLLGFRLTAGDLSGPPPGVTYFNITPCSGGGDGQRHDHTILSQYLCQKTILLQNDDMLSVAIYIAVFFRLAPSSGPTSQ